MSHTESYESRVSVQRVTVSQIRIRVTTSHNDRRDVHPHNRVTTYQVHRQ